jgi:hypothetical protein
MTEPRRPRPWDPSAMNRPALPWQNLRPEFFSCVSVPSPRHRRNALQPSLSKATLGRRSSVAAGSTLQNWRRHCFSTFCHGANDAVR